MIEMSRRGVEQTLLCGPGGDMERVARERGIETHTWRPVAANLPILNPQYAAIVRAIAPDLVHTRLSSAAAMAGFWNRRLGVPTIATLDKAAKGKYYRRADHYLSCSAWVKRRMIEEGLPAEKIDVVYNAIDAERYERNEREGRKFRDAMGVAPGETIFLAAGAFRENKGFDFLIRSFAVFAANARGAKLFLAGDGELRGALLGLIASLGLEGRVVVSAGYVQDIRPWLWGADCFVLPSRAEPFGIIVLEAMAAGLPVIVTDDGGPPEFVTDGVSGLLVPADDEPALVRAMSRLSAMDAEEVGRMIEAARVGLADFSSARVAGRHVEIYERVLSSWKAKKG